MGLSVNFIHLQPIDAENMGSVHAAVAYAHARVLGVAGRRHIVQALHSALCLGKRSSLCTTCMICTLCTHPRQIHEHQDSGNTVPVHVAGDAGPVEVQSVGRDTWGGGQQMHA
jgi:hypothetical protein